MKLRSFKMLSLVLALAFVLSVVPNIPSFAANGPIVFVGVLKNDDVYYAKKNKILNIAVTVKTSLKGKVVIKVDGNELKITANNNKTYGAVYSCGSVGMHKVTVDYIYNNHKYETDHISHDLGVYTSDAYNYVNETAEKIRECLNLYPTEEKKFEVATYLASGRQNSSSFGGAQVPGFLLGVAGNEELDNVRTNTNYVKCLYKIILHREGEESGVNYWTNELNTKSRNSVYDFFIHCDELHKTLDKYGFRYE